MAKFISKYVCQQCGYESSSWLGRCPNCTTWNSLVETQIQAPSLKKGQKKSAVFETAPLKPVKLSQIRATKLKQLKVELGDFDKVLGNGIASSSVVLLAGDPGIGKSTMLLQISGSNINVPALYVCGEESIEQIKYRAQRLKIKNENLSFLSQTNIDNILKAAEDYFLKYKEDENKIMVIDSIQSAYSDQLQGVAGSIGQVRLCALSLIDFAKNIGVTTFLVGHITKDGSIAGPTTLEHMVDTVLFLEGERTHDLRILRSYKNRFGKTSEIGVFKMTEEGMMGVENPSELFLGSFASAHPGSIVTVVIEGSKPLLVETQALVTSSKLAFPRRIASGVSSSRLQVLCAIIQKHLKLPLLGSDIYVSVASGYRIHEPASDLAIVLAIVSSFKNQKLCQKSVAIGEVGLLGEIRKVSNLKLRIQEATKLGYKNAITPDTIKSIYQLDKLLQTK